MISADNKKKLHNLLLNKVCLLKDSLFCGVLSKEEALFFIDLGVPLYKNKELLDEVKEISDGTSFYYFYLSQKLALIKPKKKTYSTFD